MESLDCLKDEHLYAALWKKMVHFIKPLSPALKKHAFIFFNSLLDYCVSIIIQMFRSNSHIVMHPIHLFWMCLVIMCHFPKASVSCQSYCHDNITQLRLHTCDVNPLFHHMRWCWWLLTYVWLQWTYYHVARNQFEMFLTLWHGALSCLRCWHRTGWFHVFMLRPGNICCSVSWHLVRSEMLLCIPWL